MTIQDEYVTVAEAARRTGYSRRHIAYLLQTEKVPGLKPGHDWFVHLPSLIKHRRTTRPGPKPRRRPGC